jgi:hypothetical protein
LRGSREFFSQRGRSSTYSPEKRETDGSDLVERYSISLGPKVGEAQALRQPTH